MAKVIRKGKNLNYRLGFRVISIAILLVGLMMFLYTFFPIISWQVYFAPVFASAKIASPIANSVTFSPGSIEGLLSNAASQATTDFTNAYNWYPGLGHEAGQIVTYQISIPKIGVENATVTNKDSDLATHLVQFNSDTFPPKEGNTVIFGHSTLPQLFQPGNYKTIFANAYKLKPGDEIIVTQGGRNYMYKIENITVVEPTDTSVLAQDFSDSFITIITCTPPGTIWKRLVIKARRT